MHTIIKRKDTPSFSFLLEKNMSNFISFLLVLPMLITVYAFLFNYAPINETLTVWKILLSFFLMIIGLGMFK